jgi:hypothetical protein
MTRPLTLLLAVLVFCAPYVEAQTTGEKLPFQVFPDQPWIDTGLDLQPGDDVEISAAAHALAGVNPPSCVPEGVGTSAASVADLPLPSAPAGAVIARLHTQGATPLAVGAGTKLHIEEPSHLFLGMNVTGTPPCKGSVTVFVRKIAASSNTAAAAGNSQQETRSEQLKSQLETAAKVFMEGQFGKGQSGSGADSSGAASMGNTATAASSAAATPLKVSDVQLDSGLRKSLDGLPRRVNDQFNNLGDMVNFVIVGSQKDVQAALDAANWHVADTSTKKAMLEAIEDTYENKDYLEMPMSTLYLFGRKQDFGYEMAEPIAMVASRHHFRIWKAPFTWKGQEVWVGAGTHDIGFAKDKRNGSVTHKIDPAVDGERDNIGSSLQKAGKAKTLSYYLPPNPVQDAKNATGDGYHSDGKLLVILLQ